MYVTAGCGKQTANSAVWSFSSRQQLPVCRTLNACMPTLLMSSSLYHSFFLFQLFPLSLLYHFAQQFFSSHHLIPVFLKKTSALFLNSFASFHQNNKNILQNTQYLSISFSILKEKKIYFSPIFPQTNLCYNKNKLW